MGHSHILISSILVEQLGFFHAVRAAGPNTGKPINNEKNYGNNFGFAVLLVRTLEHYHETLTSGLTQIGILDFEVQRAVGNVSCW